MTIVILQDIMMITVGVNKVEDKEKIKLMRGYMMAAIAIIVVLAVVILMDNTKLIKAGSTYVNGYNDCAAKCNTKLDFFRERCFIAPNITSDIPVLDDSIIETIINNTE